MGLIAAGIAAGALGLAGSLGSSAIQGAWQQKLNDQQYAYNTREANRQREFSHNEALLQREYEERMANSAYQRARADMEAAGFNPAMLAGSSSAAATPQGATAQGVAASGSAGVAPDLSGVFNSASNAILNKAARDKEFAFKLAQAKKAEVLQDAQLNYLNSAANLNQAKAGYSPFYTQKLNEDIERQMKNLL